MAGLFVLVLLAIYILLSLKFLWKHKVAKDVSYSHADQRYQPNTGFYIRSEGQYIELQDTLALPCDGVNHTNLQSQNSVNPVYEQIILPGNATTANQGLTPQPLHSMDLYAELRQTIQAVVAKRQAKESQNDTNSCVIMHVETSSGYLR